MFLRSLRDTARFLRVDGYFAEAVLPVRLGLDLAERAFIRPLERDLRKSGFGRITGFRISRDTNGEPDGLTITLSLITDAPRALRTVSGMLEKLDAPAGSQIGNAECPDLVSFGRSYGLGLYLSRAEADEEGKLAVLEACTDALEGDGLYQGSVSIGDRTALYFYGDSFNRMRAAVTFVMTTDPHCRGAYARRLN